VKIALGPRYHGAVALLRILSIAGGVTVLSNLAGNLLVALHRTRQLFITSAIAIAINVVANLLLIPRYGVYAAAWITLVTEVAVAARSLAVLRNDLPWRRLLRVSTRPTLMTLLASAAALPFLGSQWLALVITTAAYLLGLSLLRAWPVEFALAWRR
jgi:O-antigen/teichoic acid export membrane protein